MNKAALLVHASDRYELLFKGFSFFFSRYWDPDAECTCYFATEEKEADLPGFVNVRSGKGEWADRLLYLLKEQIREEYVIYFQEDMWLNAETDAVFFNQLFNMAAAQRWQQVKLHSADIYRTDQTEQYIQGFNVARIDNRQSAFLMSHQVTLWNREFLIKQLRSGEHPWRNERKGTRRLKKLSPEIFHIDYFEENGNVMNNVNREGVSRSGYYTISANGSFNDNVRRYIPDLLAAGGDYKEYAGKLEHHFIHQLVHDGQARPMKTDLFKKIKKRLRGK